MERRCREPACNRLIQILQRADHRGRWIALDPRPVRDELKDTHRQYAVAGVWAWHPEALAEHLMIRREISLAEARERTRDEFLWHDRHQCEGAPTT